MSVSRGFRRPRDLYDRILVIGLPMEEQERLQRFLESRGAYFALVRDVRLASNIQPGTGCVIVYSPGVTDEDRERLKRLVRVPLVYLSDLPGIELFVRSRLKNIDLSTEVELASSPSNALEAGLTALQKRQFIERQLPKGLDFNCSIWAIRLRKAAHHAGMTKFNRDEILGVISQIVENRKLEAKKDQPASVPIDSGVFKRRKESGKQFEKRIKSERIMQVEDAVLPYEYLRRATFHNCCSWQAYVKRLFLPELEVIYSLESYAKTITLLGKKNGFLIINAADVLVHLQKLVVLYGELTEVKRA